jgi:hypothetical protein
MLSTISRFVTVLAATLLAGSVMADGPFRCGSRIIDVGMTQAEVLESCGEPTSQTTEVQEVRSTNNRVLGTTEIHRWTYASYTATRVLVFVEDKLQSIERL